MAIELESRRMEYVNLLPRDISYVHKPELYDDLEQKYPAVIAVHKSLLKAGYPNFLVGGVLRNYFLGDGDFKDFDFHVIATKEELKTWADMNAKLVGNGTPIAWQVTMRGYESSSSELDAFDLIFVQDLEIPFYDKNYVECDVNSLAYDFVAKEVMDPFGTGVTNATKKQFRLVADSVMAWHLAIFAGRVFNGKMIRLFKLLGPLKMKFVMDSQKDEFIKMWPFMWYDYAKKVHANKFSTVRQVLGYTVRGDALNFSEPKETFQVGTDAKRVAKYKLCMDAADELDHKIGLLMQNYMNYGDKHGYDLDIEEVLYKVLHPDL